MFKTSVQWRRQPLPSILAVILLAWLVFAAAIFAGFVPVSVAQAQSTNPRITIDPTRGSPGERVTVDGSGFTPGESVRISFDGIQRATERVGNDGTFETEFIIRSTTGGSKTIRAIATFTVDVAGSDPPTRTEKTETGRATFRVESSIRMNPKEGDVGAAFSITGQGFGSREPIKVQFDGEELSCPPDRSQTDGDVQLSCQVPPVAASDYEVKANGEALGTFTVASTFSASPTIGPPGTVVQIKGTGFLPGSRVQISIGGTSLPEAVITRDGALSTQVQIPSISGGPKVIQAASPGDSGVQASFLVIPTLTVAPSSTSPGSTVKVTGTAFRANERGITVRFNSATVGSGIVADSSGFWETNITVPATTAGNHSVSASGLQTTTRVPTARVIVGTAVNLSHAGGPPGSALTVSGSGAGARERITLTVGNGLFRTETQADQNGAWSADVVIPPAPQGRMNVVARGGSSGRSTTKTFNILPAISSSTLKGTPGFRPDHFRVGVRRQANGHPHHLRGGCH